MSVVGLLALRIDLEHKLALTRDVRRHAMLRAEIDQVEEEINRLAALAESRSEIR